MKKLLAGALALGLSTGVLVAPAQAQDVRGRISVTIGDQDRYNQDRYGQDYYGRPDYEYNNGRGYGVTRHRDNNYLYWRYFANARSYYPGRCSPYYDVVVRDPRQGRLVCMSRNQYERYLYEVRSNRYYR